MERDKEVKISNQHQVNFTISQVLPIIVTYPILLLNYYNTE